MPTHAASVDLVRGSPFTDLGQASTCRPSHGDPGGGTRGTRGQGPWAVPTGAALAGHRRPRHGCFVLILEPFQPEEGCGGLVAKPSHVRVPDTRHSLCAGKSAYSRHLYRAFLPGQLCSSPYSTSSPAVPAPDQCHRPQFQLTSGQLRSEIIKWKIPEMNNS